VCNLLKKQWKTWKKAYFWDLRLEKSNTKHKTWTPWTPIFAPRWGAGAPMGCRRSVGGAGAPLGVQALRWGAGACGSRMLALRRSAWSLHTIEKKTISELSKVYRISMKCVWSICTRVRKRVINSSEPKTESFSEYLSSTETTWYINC